MNFRAGDLTPSPQSKLRDDALEYNASTVWYFRKMYCRFLANSLQVLKISRNPPEVRPMQRTCGRFFDHHK